LHFNRKTALYFWNLGEGFLKKIGCFS